jgi:outer membrane lipoprotein SlyB
MRDQARRLSLVAFAVVIVCFLLPFAELSCGGDKVAQITGIQFVTGTKEKQETPFGNAETRSVKPSPAIIGALACAVLGLVFSLRVGSGNAVASTIGGIASGVLLLVGKSNLEGEVLKEGGGMLDVEFVTAFWVALVFAFIAGALNAIPLIQRE